jgi:hypothetical protein
LSQSGEESGDVASEPSAAPDYCRNNGGTRFVTEESSFAEVFACRVIERKKQMKRTLISMALAIAAPFAWAQVSETTTTTTTTEGNGTITQYTPGSVIVLKETTGPRTYHFGKTVTYVTRSGKVLDEDVVKARVKVGAPVRVHYVGTGDNVMVDRVILDED